MKWRSLGLVWGPDPKYHWQKTHATLATPLILNRDVIRVYFYCRDASNVGRIGFVDVSASNPLKVLYSSPDPVLDIGKPGTFDDNGVVPVSVVRLSDQSLLLYYNGFELCRGIPYRILTGLARSDDGGKTFSKISRSPIMDRSDKELYFRCGNHVLVENGIFKSWYIAGSDWCDLDGKRAPVYNMHYSESVDGIEWAEAGTPSLTIDPAREHGFSRPSVMRTQSGDFEMFYSIRSLSRGYIFGYATSDDGIVWNRRDGELQFIRSASEKDTDTQCYPAIVSVGGQRYMFYNGDNYGERGLSIAIEEA